MQLQHRAITQATQDLAGSEGVEADQLPQAGVVHLGVAVGSIQLMCIWDCLAKPLDGTILNHVG